MGRSTFRFAEALFHLLMKRGQRRGPQEDLGKMLVEGWQKARSAYATAFARHMAAEMEVRHHPEHLRDLAREAANADPKYHFYGTATLMIDGAGHIDTVPAETRVRLSTLAMSVLADDAEYARWHGLVSPEDQAICDVLRADWQGKAVLAREAQRKLDAGMADWRANRDRWLKARFVPFSQGLSALLMTQSNPWPSTYLPGWSGRISPAPALRCTTTSGTLQRTCWTLPFTV